MANWDNAANNNMATIKQEFGATDGEIDNLRKQIEAWANTHGDGEGHFPFKETQVHVNQRGGWIRQVTYGN
jgi:hypothetical protein